MIRRREFIVGVSAAAAMVPMVARAQSTGSVRRVGVVLTTAEDDPVGQQDLAALRQGLQALGWREKENLAIDVRYNGIDPDHARQSVSELLSLAPSVIVAQGRPPVIVAQQAGSFVPIIFVQISDPVTAGFVASLAHPGGNITGFTNFEFSIADKWLEMLKSIAPGMKHVVLLGNNDAGLLDDYLRAAQSYAPSFAVEAAGATVNNEVEIEEAYSKLGPDTGVMIPPEGFTIGHRKLLVELASRYRVPAIYPYDYFTFDGGLISYGVDALNLFRQAADYVDRILKGTKPADLPVQAPNTFKLVVNLKTAKALGLSMPTSLIVSADQVIE